MAKQDNIAAQAILSDALGKLKSLKVDNAELQKQVAQVSQQLAVTLEHETRSTKDMADLQAQLHDKQTESDRAIATMADLMAQLKAAELSAAHTRELQQQLADRESELNVAKALVAQLQATLDGILEEISSRPASQEAPAPVAAAAPAPVATPVQFTNSLIATQTSSGGEGGQG